MRVLTVVGARPQFIKAAPLSAVLRLHHTEFLVHTGQHYDDEMSDVFFRQLNLPLPDAHLGVGSGSHAQQTSAMLVGLERLMLEQRPDWVLVYGDTNSTLAGALAAAKLHLPLAHVEAGLRSYNRAMPEEINRVLTDHLSTLLFCPTPLAVENLAREGITSGVTMTGDVMLDSVLHFLDRARQTSSILARLGLHSTGYVVATIHRPANSDSPEGLGEIISALNALDMPVVFPLHPRTRKMLHTFGLATAAHVHLIEPLGYLDMLALTANAAVVLTDSGGLQKEAYMLKVPCVTVRSETEWVETVASGWNRLVAVEKEAILHALVSARTSQPDTHPAFYGDGRAAARIVSALQHQTEKNGFDVRWVIDHNVK